MRNLVIGAISFLIATSASAEMVQNIRPDLSDLDLAQNVEYFQSVGKVRKLTGTGRQMDDYNSQLDQSIAFMHAAKACFELKDSGTSSSVQDVLTELKELGLEGQFEDLFLVEDNYMNQSDICKSMRQDSIAHQMSIYSEALNLSADEISAILKSANTKFIANKFAGLKSLDVRSRVLRGILSTAKKKADQQIE